jgi:hypothetical protein
VETGANFFWNSWNLDSGGRDLSLVIVRCQDFLSDLLRHMAVRALMRQGPQAMP